MSMLVRKATVHRKSRGTVKRKPPGTSVATRNQPLSKTTDDRDHSQSPILPKKEFNIVKCAENTVVTFNEGRQLYQTSLGHSDAPSTDYSNHSTEIWIHLQEASKDAESSCDFVCRASDILCHTCLVTLFLGLLLTLPIGMISIGVKYLTDCPVQPKIPVYLLVGGCFGLLKLIGMIWKSIQIRRYESMDLFYDANGADHAFASSTFKIMDTMLSLFLIGWHCVGSYWVFPIWQPYYEPLLHEPSNYCEKTVYLFASCQILGCFTLVCLVFLCLCGLGLCRAGTRMFQT